MIKCPYCGRWAEVVANRLQEHGGCTRGSNAKVEGDWRDDPTYRPKENQ